MKLYSRSPIPDIVACGLFLWMLVFFGAGLRMASGALQYSQNTTTLGVVYGTMATLCLYAMLGLLFRKKYAWVLSNTIFIAVFFCAVENIFIMSLIRLPAILMGTGGVLLLGLSRQEFFKKTRSFEQKR